MLFSMSRISEISPEPVAVSCVPAPAVPVPSALM
jgi:hypothetical protein